ncbi:MAG: hypothetical protein DMF61_26605 [Blastocatellia bacterium AA13]|nr:MAG: hypothetical protein DMF61_26605 [Blastocatellia bacterium AA13]
MRHSAEYDNFTKLVDRVLKVPHSVIKERIEEHRKESEKNPHKRGPKPKSKSSASGPASNGHP